MIILWCKECLLPLSAKKIHSSTSDTNDLLDKRVEVVFFNNSLMLALSTLERVFTSYNSTPHINLSKSTLFKKIWVHLAIWMLHKLDQIIVAWSALNASFTFKLIRHKNDIQVSWSCSTTRNRFVMTIFFSVT